MSAEWDVNARVAMLEQGVIDLRARVADMPTPARVEALAERQNGIRSDVTRVERQVEKLVKELHDWQDVQEKRDEAIAKDRKETFRFIVSSFLVLLAALISGFVAVLTSVH